jgi:hypothetical protein
MLGVVREANEVASIFLEEAGVCTVEFRWEGIPEPWD